MSQSVSGLDARLSEFVGQGLAGDSVDRSDIVRVLDTDTTPLLPLVHAAGLVRRRHCGTSVQVHILNNVQNGACPEDCGYCGQAKTSDAPVQAYKLKPREQILQEAEQARDSGAFRYCMVLSGRGPSDDDIDYMADCIREVKSRYGLQTCLSSGLLDEDKALRLREAGLDRLNHNLNTSERHYPEICSTHTYQDRMDTLQAARGAGLQLCTGLIVGMGEYVEDLLDVAYALRSVGAESIPVNFLVPIPGNAVLDPSVDGEALTPEFCLRVLCMMRLVNPTAEIRVAAGREIHLRHLQGLALEPANSLFIDGYLLTEGSDAAQTLALVQDAGFTLELHGAESSEVMESLSRRIENEPRRMPGSLKSSVMSERKLAKLRVRGVDVGV